MLLLKAFIHKQQPNLNNHRNDLLFSTTIRYIAAFLKAELSVWEFLFRQTIVQTASLSIKRDQVDDPCPL